MGKPVLAMAPAAHRAAGSSEGPRRRWLRVLCGLVIVAAMLNADHVQAQATGTSLSDASEPAKWLDLWAGQRTQLEQAGVSFAGTLTADESANPIGGLQQGSAFRYLLDITGQFDMEKLAHWRGATFEFDFQHQQGSNGSKDVGDIQGYDNIDANGRTQLSTFWYQQWLAHKIVRIKLGKVDAITEFAGIDHGVNFLNSSFAYSPAILNLPTYPDPAMSANVFVYPTHWLRLAYGLYDGAMAQGIQTGDHSPKTLWQGPSDFFQILEAKTNWRVGDDKLSGDLAVGGYFENAWFAQFDGGVSHGTSGGYVVAEQQVVAEKEDPVGREQEQPGRGVFLIGEFGWGDPAVNPIAQQAALGAVWTGLWAKRQPDELGVGMTTAFLSGAPGAGFTKQAETAVEAYYKWSVKSWLDVQPDVQYVVHPGGNAAIGDALVGTVRVVMRF